MRVPGCFLALIVALSFAAACSGSGSGGAGGAVGSTGSSKPVVKNTDGGAGGGEDLESTGAGW